MKTSEGNLGNAIQDMGTGKDFMMEMPKAIATTGKIDKWDIIKLKHLCTVKETINRVNWETKEWEKILQPIQKTKGWYPAFTKNSNKFTGKKQTSPFKNRQKI